MIWKQISENLKIETSIPLGQGGFATVYKGSYNNQFKVAVKELKKRLKNGSTNNYYEAEIKLSQKLKTFNNPYLVSIYEVIYPSNSINQTEQSQEQESAFIVMELCNGDLKKHINGKPSDNILGSLLIIRSIAEGLKQLHELNIIHRDLKPENIFTTIGPDGKQIYYKLGDFGLGKDQDTATTQIGTITYMAPEMLGISPVSYSKKVDIWALGVLAHEIITGVNMFYGGSVPQIRNNILKFKSYLEKRQEYQKGIQFSRDQLGDSFRRISQQDVANLLDAMLQPNPNLRCDIYGVCSLLTQTIEALDNPSYPQPVVQASPAPHVPHYNGAPWGLKLATPEKKQSFNPKSYLEKQVSDLKEKNEQQQSTIAELNELLMEEKSKAAEARQASDNELITLRNTLFKEENQRKFFQENTFNKQEEIKRLDNIIKQKDASLRQAEYRNKEMNQSFLDQKSKEMLNMEEENKCLKDYLDIKQREITAIQQQKNDEYLQNMQNMEILQKDKQNIQEKLEKQNQRLKEEILTLEMLLKEQQPKEGLVSQVKKQCHKILGKLCPRRNKNNNPLKGY